MLVVPVVLAALAVGARAHGSTLRVPSEHSSIMGAINAAVAGDTVLVAPGTYTNCDEAPCTATVAEPFEGLTLLSEGGPDVTRLELVDGGPSSGLRVVRGEGIGPGGTHVEGFEIMSPIANSRGLAFVDCWNVRVVNCRLVEIETSFSSGGGLIQTGGSLELVGCEFVRCTAAQQGGGIKVTGTGSSQTVVRDCLFEECGPTAFVASGGGDIEVTGCVFRNNFGSNNQVGGLALGGVDTGVVRDCLFVENAELPPFSVPLSMRVRA
jgi:hypothetical protein